MPREVALTAERAPAEQTHKRPLTRVFPNVQLKIFLRAYALAAERARKPALAVALPLLARHQAERSRVGGGALELVGARLALRAVGHRADTREGDGRAPPRLAAPALALGARRAALPRVVDGHGRVGRSVRVDGAVLLRVPDRIYRRRPRLVGPPLLHREVHLAAAADECLVGARHVVDVRVGVLRVQPLQRVVKSVLLERLEVAELHAADVARK